MGIKPQTSESWEEFPISAMWKYLVKIPSAMWKYLIAPSNSGLISALNRCQFPVLPFPYFVMFVILTTDYFVIV